MLCFNIKISNMKYLKYLLWCLKIVHLKYSRNCLFNKYLFNILAHVQDPINVNNLIFHPFFVFQPNQQHDSFEGCDKWFEVIAKIT